MNPILILQIIDGLLQAGQFASTEYARWRDVRDKVNAVVAEGRDFTDAELSEISILTDAKIVQLQAVKAADLDDGA